MSSLLWARCRGRDGWSSPLDIPDDMAAEAVNWHFYEGALGTKRGGSTSVSVSGMSEFNFLYRFLPGQDETAAEFFAVDNSATNQILRMAGGATFTALTLKDNIAANDTVISMAVLNGKLYIAYDSAVNRLHVFDPGVSTTLVRRAGHATPAAPTAADTGVGAYAAVLRYYRIQWRTKSGSVILRRSLLGTALSFTTSGSGTHARVTQPTLPSEGETHWAIYGSADDEEYYELAEVAIGTTTYDDNETPSAYGTGNDVAPSEGAYTPFPSVKYLATDGERLLGYGVWETAAGDSHEPKAGRVFFTPVLDSLGLGDDERVSGTTEFEGWIDISRNAGSVDRGISPRPLNGVFYVFQSRGVTMLVPTTSAITPYRRVTLSSELGAVSNQSIVMAEDEAGHPCLYFLDPELGPYRIGAGGLQRCGKDVQDVWDTVNHGATSVVACGAYYKSLNLVMFAVSTGANNDPDKMLVFDVTEGRVGEDGIRGGWTIWTGDFANARCMAMFAATLGATMGRSLVPYVGKASTTKLLRYNPAATADDATAFRGYVTSRAFVGDTLIKHKTVMKAFVLASAETGVTLTQGYIRNFGDETNRTDTALLTAAGSETKVLKRFESPELADAYTFQVELGDASAAATAFTLERWWADYKELDTKGN